MEKDGEIKNLRLQPVFKFEIEGKPLKTNKKGAKQLKYIADFEYTKSNGEKIIEDVKSKITEKLPVFTYKKALMWTIYGIDIKIF